MSNEEKILAMLTSIQADIQSLKEKKSADELENLSPEERKARQLAALDAFQKVCIEDADGAEKFSTLMNEPENLSPEERKSRQMAAFDAFINSTTDDDEPEATAKFFELMDELEARRSAS